MHIQTSLVVLAALTSAAAYGCTGGSDKADENNPPGVSRASLHRAKSCPDLLTDLRADAKYKVNRGINRQIEQIRSCVAVYGEDRCAGGGGYYAVAEDMAGPGRATAGAAPPSSPAPSGAESANASDGKSSASSYSETNTQVKGVDEADFVKNDGKNIYVLHGREFKVVNAWPATDLGDVGTQLIEGVPSEMFVSDGKVVVYSQVNGASIFAKAGITPKQTYQDYYGYERPNVAVAPAADIAIAPYPGPGGETISPLTKITVLELDGTTPRVTREFYFEGNYLDARRVGTNVRSVFQGYAYGPKLKYGIHELDAYAYKDGQQPNYPQTASASIAALEQLRSANLAAIEGSQLSDWLPYTFTKNGEAVSAELVACEDFYVPNAGSTESGITQVAALDLANPAAPLRQSAVLGAVDTVYGSADTLYLAARAYVEPPYYWSDPWIASSGGGTVASPPSPGMDAPAGSPSPRTIGLRNTQQAPIVTWSTTSTHVHKFEFATDARFPNYVASGTVNGQVKNQFSLDDKDGVLRIATTEQRAYITTNGQYVELDRPTDGSVPQRPSTVNHVFTLAPNGPWLDVKGEVPNLAPNEQIFSARFVGNRGYVVTFRQVDPLFVIDLANPEKPELLAELKIPGFSEYMHPIDDTHLLTIGRDATAEGRTLGLQLQIFDVTDGRNPRQTQKYTYTNDEYGSSEAQHDHKAFTYFADKNLLAFPYYSYGNTGAKSTLELFKVDMNAGFTKLGSLDSSELLADHPQGYCGGYYGPSVRRGIFLENFVYSVSYGGIVVKDVNNLLAPVDSLKLPAPTVDPNYYGAKIACQ